MGNAADPGETVWHEIRARQRQSWEAGERLRVEALLELYGAPDLDDEPLLELILCEFRLRRELGENPSSAEYLERFPQHAACLEQLFDLNNASVTVIPSSQVDAGDSMADYALDKAAPAEPPERIGRYRVERVLGQGAFGLVYLARDEQLDRHVAVKVPHARLVSSPEDAAAYLAEARTVARLDHPHIVPVYDVGSTPEFPCYVVSRYIAGSDLAQRLRQSRLTPVEAADVVATVAEALHYAHKQGLVHRDVKPGNILIDAAGKPYVVDFGLALREQDLGQGAKFAGTPAYMSPEQARGEGHRVDGRSDIFSLGVVLYELLVGRRPFIAESRNDLLEQITTHEPRPPRQADDSISKELERICFKALSKRATERYSTAHDLADDLRNYLAAPDGPGRSTAPSARPQAATPPTPASTPVDGADASSDNRPLRIVPKGLRSFDEHDADFFLELLPGPRDRNGLPDSLRFWKTRIEETDADRTFAVGLIYGPSGCGKSSLVKAGLLPRLSPNVIAVYLEATAEETEARLRNGLRKRCPTLPDEIGLVETLAALRRGQGVPAGRKVLIVLDQFEQWLHTNKDQQNTDLVQALRQCDGSRVQCVVMVRDDFWLAVSRFLKELEVRLVEGQNVALADLFDADHARKVLAAFGRAFGRLLERSSETTVEQQAFLKAAIGGLAEEGKVISVRLALFVEMMKGRPWTPAALKDVGGTQGIGATFLEETFSAGSASPEHRYHQQAARAVLKALLPESGTDIKGHMRSREELLEASGYSSRPRDFADLLRMLDSEIRLITPTDPEGQADGAPAAVVTGEKYCQLTHDYLVPSLRDWLMRKQKETRRGRAELLLTDRAAVWSARPESRQLPSLTQWLQVRWLTTKKHWTAPERKMMQTARRHHAVRGAAVVLVLAALGWAGYETHGRLQARALRDRLLDANTADVPAIVAEMAPYRRWLAPLLRVASREAHSSGQPRKQLHAGLALLPVDPGQVDDLYGRLLAAQPHEVRVLCDALAPHRAALVGKLWNVVAAPDPGKESQRLRAASALAQYDSDNRQWAAAEKAVGNDLVAVPAVYLSAWMDALRPVRTKLFPQLSAIYRDGARRETERSLATDILADYAADAAQVLASLLLDADAKQFAVIYARFQERADQGLPVLIAEIDRTAPADAPDGAREALAKRQANAAVALVRLNQPAKVWPLLRHSPDPQARSYLIHRLGPLGADAGVLIRRLDEELDVTIRRALVLSLGEFTETQLPASARRPLIKKLLGIFETEPDAGLHAAAEWLLRQWDTGAEVRALTEQLQADEAQRQARNAGEKRQWYVNSQGQTMVILEPGEFQMGTPETEPGRLLDELHHLHKIGRRFAIAAHEVTRTQFALFQQEHPESRWLDTTQFVKTDDSAQVGMTWYEAAWYCNWLSEQEGIPEDQWWYEPNSSGEYGPEMKAKGEMLNLAGYRLPTEAEWEYACRAGASTSRYFGSNPALLPKYALFLDNGENRTWPVASLKPNDAGLFDMLGNVAEWCHDSYKVYRVGNNGRVEESIDAAPITDDNRRQLRGGSFTNRSSFLRSGCRSSNNRPDRNIHFGFRAARTYP